jgi:hypothetical protein
MKDIIWTLIIVWLIYKIIEVFQSSAKKNLHEQNHVKMPVDSPKNPENRDLKDALKKHLNKEGEYVDFEEIK